MHTINALAAIFVLLATAAHGEVPATGAQPTGAPHACSQFYPSGVVAEGTTALAFRITADGSTKGVTVAKSSGSAELDAAAVECVNGWHYVPATRDGKAAEIGWNANVEWKLRSPDNVMPPAPLQTHVCHNYPHSAIWQGAEGNVIVSFNIAVDGTVKNLAIVKTTGDDDLDRATLACASTWHYRPATRDGVAMEIPWNAQVNWMMHGHVMSPCGSYAKVTPDLLAGISGVTKVSLRIQQDGSVSDTGLMRSSGNDTLDQAALLCVSRMRFDVSRAKLPTSGIAKSLSVNWGADLPPAAKKTEADKFQNPSEAKLPGGTTPPTVVQFSFCGPPSGSKTGDAGTTEISFRIGTDGIVKAAAISKSSGDQALDNATEKCVAAWKYAPATKDGKPVEVDWSEHIDWSRH